MRSHIVSSERNIIALGTSIFNSIKKESNSIFSSEFYSSKLMNWAMDDEVFRTNLLRFVDVMPSLNTSEAIIQHAQEYFLPLAHKFPSFTRWGLHMSPNCLLSNIIAPLVKKQIRLMAKRFILGQDPKDSLSQLKKIRKQGMAFTVPLLGEAVVSEQEAHNYLNRYLELIQTLHKEVPTWSTSKPIISGHPGEETPVNVSIKLSVLYSQAQAISTEKSINILAQRLTKIVKKAHECNTFLYVDMEEHEFVDITLGTVKKVLKETGLNNVGFVFQAYLRRTEQDLIKLLDWIKTEYKQRVTLRLVKGAYWDSETIHSKIQNWPIPVWQEKSASDVNYEKLTHFVLDNNEWIYPAFGSHNIRSLCNAIEYAKEIGLTTNDFELQTLYGMGQPIKNAFLKHNLLIREYAPVGEFITGIAYLVRRILENTSNKGFIKNSFHDGDKPEVLLQKPKIKNPDTGTEHINTHYKTMFTNSPYTDFSIQSNRTKLANAIDTVSNQLKKKPTIVQPIVDGKKLTSNKILDSISPQETQFILANTHMASVEQAEQALISLKENFPAWRNTPLEQRTDILFKTAEILEQKRSEFTAIIILETGKPWIEADADMAEAIDFLNYYAHEAKKLFKIQTIYKTDGEDNTYFYEPRGVCLSIAPWNFPCAIPCGMFCAALVTGNCAILKPAEQSPLIAYKLFECFEEAGLPSGVAAFLPGYGEEIGEYMVKSALTDTIVFTGSKDVGLHIIEEAAKTKIGQTHVKRTISEMGGKNAIVIDSDADLDVAVKKVIYSSFGYAGQKCSACSRVIVVEEAYQRFIQRLKEATQSVVVGNATDPNTTVGPVIDEEAYNRLNAAIKNADTRGKILAQAPMPSYGSKGYFVQPTVVYDLELNDDLVTKEYFGPFTAVIKAKTFEDAIDIALSSEYALTGAAISRSPKNLEYAARNFRVGNLYLNTGCTGAMVNRQPFGGAYMSGTGSKAGGPDYLHQFIIPRTISENTMRQGFAPMSKNQESFLIEK